MKEGKNSKCEIQKGPIEVDQKTMKYVPLSQNIRESEVQNRGLREGQKQTLHMPKK